MAISDLIANPFEWELQWRRLPEESFAEDLYSKAITIGSIVAFPLMVGAVLAVTGIGRDVILGVVNTTVSIPMIGDPKIVPSLVAIGGFGAALLVIDEPPGGRTRERLSDDKNTILLAIGFVYVLSVVLAGDASVNWPASLTAGFAGFAILAFGVYLWRGFIE